MTFIPDTILHAICWTLLHSLWQGLIFAIVAGIVLVLTKKASSSLRYTLLCGGMLLFLAISGYTFYRQLHIPATGTLTTAGITPIGKKATTETTAPVTPVHITSHTLSNGIDSLVQYFNAHASLVVVIWFIIFLARFVQVLSGVVYAQRVRHYQTSAVPMEWQQRLSHLLDRLQITRPVSLLQSGLVKVPTVVGWLKPVILVPIGMLTHISPEQVESILLHELAHIRRQDYIFNLVQHVVDTLFFFNPALLWVSSLIRTERENCCDDIAIHQTNSRRRLIEALVSFHEYRKSAQPYALALTGKNNSVVRRVERIVYRKNHSLNAGERLLLMSGIMLLSVAFITIDSSRRDVSASSALRPPAHGFHWSSGSTFPLSELGLLPADKAGTFVVKRDPGTVTFNGTFTNDRGHGTYIFETNPAFSDYLSQEGFKNITEELMLHLFFTNINKEYFSYMKQNGYAGISLDQLKDLAYQNINRKVLTGYFDLFKQEGYGKVPLEEIVELREHGVSPDFISSFHEMGYKNIPLDLALELKDHGVNPDFVAEMKKVGAKDITLNEAIELRDHGVSVEFIHGFKELGYTNMSLEKATELRDHGVDVDFVKQIKQLGFADLDLSKAVELRDHGVTAGYIKKMQDKGLKNLSLDQYIRLRDSGM